MGRDLAGQRPENLMVRASVGAQGWASVPWLAFFAPYVTRSMRHGLYVVFFINAHDERITLSLQHGAGAALTGLGQEQGRIHLRHMALATQKAADGWGHDFSDDPITLGSKSVLPMGYEAGCALSRTWDAATLLQDALLTDLAAMLDIYHRLTGPLP